MYSQIYILLSYVPLVASFVGCILWLILSIKKKTNTEIDVLGSFLPLVMFSAYIENNNSVNYSDLVTIAAGIFIPFYFLAEVLYLYHQKNKK